MSIAKFLVDRKTMDSVTGDIEFVCGCGRKDLSNVAVEPENHLRRCGERSYDTVRKYRKRKLDTSVLLSQFQDLSLEPSSSTKSQKREEVSGPTQLHKRRLMREEKMRITIGFFKKELEELSREARSARQRRYRKMKRRSEKGANDQHWKEAHEVVLRAAAINEQMRERLHRERRHNSLVASFVESMLAIRRREYHKRMKEMERKKKMHSASGLASTLENLSLESRRKDSATRRC